MNSAQREFLEAVRDGRDVIPILQKHDLGYGWAIETGLVTKHPAFFEFYLTSEGRAMLAAASPAQAKEGG